MQFSFIATINQSVQISLFLTSNLLQSISSINYNPNLNVRFNFIFKINSKLNLNEFFIPLYHDNNDISIDLTDIFSDSI